MALDFQQLREQVRQLGENAPLRDQRLKELREQACGLLKTNSHRIEELRLKVQEVVRSHDPTLRCALPVGEALDDHFSQPNPPLQATVLAADGSQIAPDRHAEIEYGLINVGVIGMVYGSAVAPVTTAFTHLFYDEDLYTSTGIMSDALLALRRDLNERTMLARQAAQAIPPVITFTDGLMEIYASKELVGEEASEFQKSLTEYLEVLFEMQSQGVITAGYVDKPGTTLVIRLLEVAMISDADFSEIKKYHPLRGIYDIDLYKDLLHPGERSPVFAVQSPSSKVYTGSLSLHFFYLNVGRPGHPSLSRIEIPAWVSENQGMLDSLHAVVIDQCRVMGSKPYPYLLHRAHETALVSLQEKEQITAMIALELRKRGVKVGEQSQKQANKDLSGRTRYEG